MAEQNNPKKAVAIKYDPSEVAPKVVAKGTGYVAEQILQKAKDNNISIHNDPHLIHLLNFVEIGEHIPDTLYEIVAKVLTYVENIDKMVRDSIINK